MIGNSRFETDCTWVFARRLLVAVGTMLREHSRVRYAARDTEIPHTIASLKHREGRIGEVAKEIDALMRL